jgi:hypothetical protein
LPSKVVLHSKVVRTPIAVAVAAMEVATTTTVEMPKLERRSSAPVKRRVSRACDHCHRMRTRCNGQAPCSRCIELEYVCQYNREKKRRGKVCIVRVMIKPGGLQCVLTVLREFAKCIEDVQPSHSTTLVLTFRYRRYRGTFRSNAKRPQQLDTVLKHRD